MVIQTVNPRDKPGYIEVMGVHDEQVNTHIIKG